MSYKKYALLGIILFVGASLNYSASVHASSNSEYKLEANTDVALLEADNFYIKANDLKFRADVSDIDIHSDPGDNEYCTLELTWTEHDREMRLYIYFTSDGEYWWSDEIRIYNGQKDQFDWVYFNGTFFKSPLDEKFSTNEFELTKEGGVLHFENLSIQAFSYMQTLSTSSEPSNGGSILLSPSGGAYEEGTEVTVTAENAEGYEFDHWEGDLSGSDPSRDLTMDSDKSVTAYFTEEVSQYSLSTSVGSGSGSISLSPLGGTYDIGTNVTVTAVPAFGYKFDHWSGNISGTSKTTSITMDSNKTITAHFVEVFDLSTSTEPTEGGSISVSPSKDSYREGNEVTFTAEPSEGYEFDHWSGDIEGSSKTKTVTMDSDLEIVAHYTETGGLPLTWIGLGIGVVIALIAGIAIGKKT